MTGSPQTANTASSTTATRSRTTRRPCKRKSSIDITDRHPRMYDEKGEIELLSSSGVMFSVSSQLLSREW